MFKQEVVKKFRILGAEDKKTLYHGTNTRRIKSIEKSGLDPHAEKASNGENFVYLTDSPEIAAEFSGFGTDAFGMIKEGYMASKSGKLTQGIVLTVQVDPKFLKPDQIWQKKLDQLKDRDKAVAEEMEAVKKDMNGNQVLEFRVENEAHRLAKKAIAEDPSLEDDDLEVLQEEFYEEAEETVARRFAEKAIDAQLAELKSFTSRGKLFQYSKPIPPEDIVAQEPAKKYIKA